MNPGVPPAPFGGTAGSMHLYGNFTEQPRPDQICPHCNGVSQIVPHAELHFACSICGAPRIRLPEGMVPSSAMIAALKKAETARTGRGFAKGTTIVGGLGSAFGAVLGVLGLLIGGLAWGLALAAIFGGPFVAPLLIGLSRTKSRDAEMKKFLDAAWATAAAEVVRAGKGATATDLANALGIDPARAEQLHAIVSLDASLTTAPDERVRVNVPPDPRFEALEQRARIADPNAASIEARSIEEGAEAEIEAAIHGPGGARVPPKQGG